MPSPKCMPIAPPSRSSTTDGTNQEVIPGPVATVAHTSSGVPGTSTSRRMARVMSLSLVLERHAEVDRVRRRLGARNVVAHPGRAVLEHEVDLRREHRGDEHDADL